MAFRDENGKITIDEIAAASDIRHIESAKEHMATALNMLTNMTNQASNFSGKTGESIVFACNKLQKQIMNTIVESEKAIDNIKQTIKKYEQIDRNLKDIIEGANINEHH